MSDLFLRNDAESYTNLDIVARTALWSNVPCSEYWSIEIYYHGSWDTLNVVRVDNATSYAGEVSAECWAGTWTYRVEASGYHSQAVRATCNDRNNPFRIA